MVVNLNILTNKVHSNSVSSVAIQYEEHFSDFIEEEEQEIVENEQLEVVPERNDLTSGKDSDCYYI